MSFPSGWVVVTNQSVVLDIVVVVVVVVVVCSFGCTCFPST